MSEEKGYLLVEYLPRYTIIRDNFAYCSECNQHDNVVVNYLFHRKHLHCASCNSCHGGTMKMLPKKQFSITYQPPDRGPIKW